MNDDSTYHVDYSNPANTSHYALGEATHGLTPLFDDWRGGTTVVGYTVGFVDGGTIRLDLMGMLYNWRLCETLMPTGFCYARSWCYAGRGAASFLVARAAAYEWALRWAPDTEPRHWTKANRAP